ncbi:hypothetical protein AB0L80_04350 [Streptomyces sp. NPDC052069]|uniref:hypothetical protein n=1 Tax=Streptomyces sp. NPDC052069 TaxID=3154650 RepID=UPI00343D3A41
MTTPETVAPPGPGFVAGVRFATGVRRIEAFTVAQLLAYHVPPRLPHESVERIGDGMQALAGAMNLGAHDAPAPYVGHRIRIRNGFPWLDYGDDTYKVRVTASAEWVRLVAAGTPVRVYVLFDPLAAGAGQEATAEHAADCFNRGAMRWGTAYHV